MSEGTADDLFTADVVAAVVGHLNRDHADDCVRIVRALADLDAERATARTVDAHGIEFEASLAGGGSRTVRLPWSAPVRERADIRAEVVRMHERAAAG